MKNDLGMLKPVLAVLLMASLFACSGGGSGGASSLEGQGSVNVKMKADFGTSELSASSPSMLIQLAEAAKIDTCPIPPPSMDDSGYAAGLDCDNDGGIIRYITPSSFKVAIKRLTFLKDDGDTVEIIPDTVTLADAKVYDLTSEVSLFQEYIAAGNYPTFEAEFYYYEIQMEMNDPPLTQSIRVYLSDDDFPEEGNLGHHQGDITLIDADGIEIGWVQGCEPWEESGLQAYRGNISGAGETDPETGHLRGLYGNMELWNQQNFMQGSGQDIYVTKGVLGLTIQKYGQNNNFFFQYGRYLVL